MKQIISDSGKFVVFIPAESGDITLASDWQISNKEGGGRVWLALFPQGKSGALSPSLPYC